MEALPFGLWDDREPPGFYTSRYSVYLLCWYKSTNADAEGAASTLGRASRDCLGCSAVRGGVEDASDGSYKVLVNVTRTGAYKIVSELLLQGGVAATYYGMHAVNSTEVGAPAFVRMEQQLDSVLDFASPCSRYAPQGLLPMQMPGNTSSSFAREQVGCDGWVTGGCSGGSRTSLLLDATAWSVASLEAFTQSCSDWSVLVTRGSCQGQWRNLSAVSVSSTAETGALRLLNVTVGVEWDTSGGYAATGPFGESTEVTWYGCKAPDITSYYAMLPRSRAPGSMSASGIFATRWAGFVRTPRAAAAAGGESTSPPTSPPPDACRYSLFVHLSASPRNQERVKVWLHNSLLIDQWSSLDALAMSTTVSLLQDSIYRLEILYKRAGVGGASHAPRMLLHWSPASSEGTACGAAVTTSKSAIPSHCLWTGWRVPMDDEQGILQLHAGRTHSISSLAFGAGTFSDWPYCIILHYILLYD